MKLSNYPPGAGNEPEISGSHENDDLERRIVRDLCAHLLSKGFTIEAGYSDGEEDFPVDGLLHDIHENGFWRHWILLAPGEGANIIADHSVGNDDDLSGFYTAMKAFDVERYAT